MNKYRILIVDDEQAIRDALKEWLEMNGYEVTVAIGVEDVIWLSDWQWQGFNCIVTGINQPGLNGLEFTNLVKSCDGPPVVVGIISGILAVGIFAWKFKETSLCRP